MAINKRSKKADALANLYRAARYLALGDKDLGLDFWQKTRGVLDKSTNKRITSLPNDLAEKIKTRQVVLFRF